MGKGDKKSKRGKINRGTFGKRRLRKKEGFQRIITPKEEKRIIEKKPEEPKPEVKTEKKKTTRKKKEKKDSEKKDTTKEE